MHHPQQHANVPILLTWCAVIIAATFFWSIRFGWSGTHQLLIYVAADILLFAMVLLFVIRRD